MDLLTFHLSIKNSTFIVSLINAKKNCAFRIVHCLKHFVKTHKNQQLSKMKIKKLFSPFK